MDAVTSIRLYNNLGVDLSAQIDLTITYSPSESGYYIISYDGSKIRDGVYILAINIKGTRYIRRLCILSNYSL